MQVRDIKNHIFDKVSIYKQKNDNWDELEDIYNGYMQEIPVELLDLNIHLIGAKRKGVVDISIKED